MGSFQNSNSYKVFLPLIYLKHLGQAKLIRHEYFLLRKINNCHKVILISTLLPMYPNKIIHQVYQYF